MYKCLVNLLLMALPFHAASQTGLKWVNVDSLYQPLPPSIHVYFTNNAIDTAPFRAFYVVADLKDKNLEFTTDTTWKRRLTPTLFFERNNRPLIVVNCTFFSFETNKNLNVVVKDGKKVSFNTHIINGRGRDTLMYYHVINGAIGISNKRKADIAWVYADSTGKNIIAFEKDPVFRKDSSGISSRYTFAPSLHHYPARKRRLGITENWKMQAAVGGGPVLLQDGEVRITNNEERKFAGSAINDKHPRTVMGYTGDNRLIILMIEGRNTVAHGATLQQEAQMCKDLGCVEALNLDGGGSSCLLINGKETITVSDKEGQRPVPAVFMIKMRDVP